MGKKPRGLNAAKKLKKRRTQFIFAKKDSKRMKTKIYKKRKQIRGFPHKKKTTILLCGIGCCLHWSN